MVSRTFCIPGIFFLLAATGLLIVTSISLPYLPALDIVRVHITSGAVVLGDASTSSSQSISQLRFGIWSYCADQLSTGNRECSSSGHGYSVSLSSSTDTVTIESPWTRGLAVIPVAAAVSFIAFLLSFSTHMTVTLMSSLVSFLAAILTFIAFIIEIALFAWVHHQAGDLGVGENTNTAPGFWLTFASLLLLLFAGCTVCFGRRRERMASATDARPTAPLWSRWRKNKV
jgi:hypothetical protein